MTATVDDYRVAREAQLRRLEDYANTTDRSKEDARGFYGEAGDGGAGREEPLTWKRWMKQTAQPAPSPDDLAAVERADVARLQDAHSAAEDLRERYERAAAERGAIMAELVAAGHAYGDVGSMVGVTRARVHQLVSAHVKREAGTA